MARYAATTSFPVDAWYSRLEVHGTEGAYIYSSGGPEDQHTWWTPAGGEWTETAPFPFAKRWRSGNDNFANSVRTGEPLSICGRVGCLSRVVLDGIYESANLDGEWVDIEEV